MTPASLIREARHTPGPWVVEVYGDKIHIGHARSGRIEAIVATVTSNPSMMLNAQVMAAGPDLLIALKDCVALLERLFANPAPHGQINRGRAAIAKAERPPALMDKAALAAEGVEG